MSTLERLESSYQRQLDAMLEVDVDNLIAKGRHNLTKSNTLFYYGKKTEALKIEPSMNYNETIQLLASTAVLTSKHDEIWNTMNRDRLLEDFAKGKVEGSIRYERVSKEKDGLWAKVKYSLFKEPTTNEVIVFIYTYDITNQVVDERIISKLSSMEYDAMGLLDVKTHQYKLRNILNKIEGPKVVGKGNFDERVIKRLPLILVPEEREEITRKFQVENIISELEDKNIYYFTYFVIDDKKEKRRKKCQFTYLDDAKSSILYCRSDITEAYNKEQEQLAKVKEALQIAEEANEAKSDFLARMSHDIRTPMNTIFNLTQMVKAEIDDKEAALADLSKIEASNHFLLALINDILDMSRIEQKRIVLHPERYVYSEFWEYLSSTFLPQATKKNINLSVKKGNQNVDILVDKVRFNQMCFNLISNAIKYTPEGGHVTFEMVHGDIVDDILACDIYITDDGIGMSKEFQAKMFEPFAQEGRAYKSIEGTGLGLSIVKEIVELFHGTIEVDSEIDKGTSFHIHMNMTVLEPEETKEKDVETDLEILKDKCVLLVEDHTLNQEIATRLLKKVGVTVKIANNGAEAVDEFSKNYADYAAILMDMRMPVMDGLTATMKIRELLVDNAKQIPIIAMTANAFAEDMEKSAKAGMNAHLAKPINPEIMYATLAKLIAETQKKAE